MARNPRTLRKCFSWLASATPFATLLLGCASALPPDDPGDDPTPGGTPPVTSTTPALGSAAPSLPPGQSATPPPVLIGAAGMPGGGLFGDNPDTTDTNVSVGVGTGGAAGSNPGDVTTAGAGTAGSPVAPPVVSPSGCDFALVDTTCAARACMRCNPQPTFDLNFTTTCEAIISCVDTTGCSTEADLLCAKRDVAAGTPNTCTSQAEQGGIGNDSGAPTPYNCALALYECACTVP